MFMVNDHTVDKGSELVLHGQKMLQTVPLLVTGVVPSSSFFSMYLHLKLI